MGIGGVGLRGRSKRGGWRWGGGRGGIVDRWVGFYWSFLGWVVFFLGGNGWEFLYIEGNMGEYIWELLPINLASFQYDPWC